MLPHNQTLLIENLPAAEVVAKVLSSECKRKKMNLNSLLLTLQVRCLRVMLSQRNSKKRISLFQKLDAYIELLIEDQGDLAKELEQQTAFLVSIACYHR